VCYLETGVRANRHFGGKASIGASMLETHAGIRIMNVAPGGFAEEAGLARGDLLVRLGGAAILRRSDVWAVERAHGPGARIEAEYVRDGALQSGGAALSAPNFTEVHGLAGA
jgi:S1-C subfamily serine protease